MSRGTIAALGGGAGGTLFLEHLVASLPLEFFSTPAGLLLVVVACFLVLLGGALVALRALVLLASPTGRRPPGHDVPRLLLDEPIEPPARPHLSGTSKDVLQLGEGPRDGA